MTASPSAELVFLLWDLQYSVLLASRTMSLSSSIQRSKKQGIKLQLSGSSGAVQQAFLVLSPTANGEAESSTGDAAQRSSILVVPLVVPQTSTLANAIGRASAAEQWLAPAPSPSTQAASSSSGMDGAQAKVLRVMRTAMEQKRVEAADDAFFAWVAQQEGAKGGIGKKSFGYQFTKQVLEIVLRAPKNATADIPYSPKVLQYLLQQRCVSAGMVECGLFPALQLRNDWVCLVQSI